MSIVREGGVWVDIITIKEYEGVEPDKKET